MQPEKMKHVLEALSASQEMIEKSSFDSINQHDKVTNLVSELTINMNNIMMRLDAINDELDEIVNQQNNAGVERNSILALSKLLEEQNLLQIEVSQCLQTIINEQSLESEVIHDMEMQIAEQREIINEAGYIEE